MAVQQWPDLSDDGIIIDFFSMASGRYQKA